MRYTVDSESKKPAYLQLYEKIRADVVDGVYPYGAKLPSKRLIAEEAGVSTVTVEHTYALLCDEGYARARERSGYFVCFRRDGVLAPYSAVGEGVLVHTVQKHPAEGGVVFPFSVLAKTMRRVISEYGEEILDKSPNCGCDELRSAISRYLLRSRGIKAEVEQIVIGSGAEYLYGLCVGLLGRDRVYAIESPSYEKIEKVYLASEVEYEKLPMGADGIDSRALEATAARVLHISPYRSFPSRISASASKRHEYLRWAEKRGGIIIEDDFESEFSVSAKPEETLFALCGGEKVIYMNTFSKTVSPAVRTGYMVLPPHLVKPFREKLGFYSCTVPTFEQLVLASLISGGDFERHINRVRRRKRRDLEKG